MAYATGTATDRVDLWDKLLSFLTTNAGLVAANQNWEVVWSKDSTGNVERTLKGRGLTGTDEIYVSLSRRDDQFVAGESVLWITGSTGVSPSASSFNEHPNSLQRYPAMFLDSGPMQYWFVANGRRFIVVVKISTIYNAIYGGLFLPYSTPVSYTYPLFIGGSRGFSGYTPGNGIATSWRQTEANWYRMFVRPFGSAGPGAGWYDTSAAMLDPTGIWKGVVSSGSASTPNTAWMSPWGQQITFGGVTVNPADPVGGVGSPYYRGVGYRAIRNATVEGLDGEIPCTPFTLAEFGASNPESPTIYGILDGCFEISANSPTAESTFTMNGVDHIIFQNVQRTNVGSYWALALE